jgi:hypothetical protein
MSVVIEGVVMKRPALSGAFAGMLCKCRSVADTNAGFMFIEFVFPPNAVTIFASVAWLPPRKPKLVPVV